MCTHVYTQAHMQCDYVPGISHTTGMYIHVTNGLTCCVADKVTNKCNQNFQGCEEV